MSGLVGSTLLILNVLTISLPNLAATALVSGSATMPAPSAQNSLLQTSVEKADWQRVFKRLFLVRTGLSGEEHIAHQRDKRRVRLSAPKHLWDAYGAMAGEERRIESQRESFGRRRSGSKQRRRASCGDCRESKLPAAAHDANTVRSVVLQSVMALEESSVELTFNLSPMTSSESVMEAELRLFLDPLSSLVSNASLNLTFRVNVYEIINSSQGITRLVATKLTRATGGWHAFDVTPAVVHRASRHPSGHMMELVVQLTAPASLTAGLSSAEALSPLLVGPLRRRRHRPTVVLYGYDERLAARRSVPRRRSDGTTEERRQTTGRGGRRRKAHRRQKSRRRHRIDTHKQMCQRREVYVDFRELNWQDWILAPVGFTSYYCAGSCRHPLSAHQNATNHAIVQALVNGVSPGATPEPCCVPTAMSSISMLYIDANEHILIKNYPDMVVEGCGCR